MKILLYFFSTFFFTCNNAFAYIDPASGSAIMSAIIGAAVLIGVFFKTFWYKLKSLFVKQNNSKKPSEITKNNKNLP
jgi:hypothetical protein